MKHTRVRFKLICLVLAAASLFGLTACGETKELQKMISAMDTEMTLTAYGNNAESGLNAATAIITSMDSMLDPDLTTSVTYAINNANGDKVVISGQVAQMISAAKTVYEHSEGAFDLTVYPLVELWGFSDRRYYVPTDEEILSELDRLCFDELILTSFPSTGTYTMSMPSYGRLSFASCAKGCAAANAIEAMRNAGVTSAIISLGGNVQTLGTKPDGTNWNIAITDPNNTGSYLGVLSLGEAAVVTSGGYQRYFEQNGKTYIHIIKPKSGYPVNNTLKSVTIICQDGTYADCLSTALFVLGESAALSYWRSYGKTDGGGFDMVLVNDKNEITITSGLIEQFTLANKNYTVKYTE